MLLLYFYLEGDSMTQKERNEVVVYFTKGG
jgi:hypothetical protein